ncbi:upstream activation factor subunit spp27 isoform X2 [Ziziphus jujuba]|uniref:Upstream activation factor subunit spp27 isoform X2 n=1 Tax=Ziziphus jujuba TaxID=326968 RepID=A0A6P3Z8K5_ZIZJJ|nr:upstream activation factor subunit spp27 isoform X2 [Ziziphus jujuba]
MVSDSDLVTRLQDILRNSDLDTATPGSIRRQLQEYFGVDLSDRKAFIREQIDIFLETHMAKPPQDDEPKEEEEEEEEDTVPDVPDDSENVKDEEMLEVQEQEIVGGEEEEEEDEEDEREGNDNKKAGSNQIEKVKKRGGFNKLCSLSPQLQELVGEPQMARTQVVKKLWAYIREHNLQDPKNKRNIKCDESLHAIFRVNSINMFQMNKALSKHIWPLEPKVKDDESNHSESQGSNGEKQGEEDDEKDSSRQAKKKRGCGILSSCEGDQNTKRRGGGFTKLCSLSPQLQALIGESELSRPGVVKQLWKHIRDNNLQDPKNKRIIICDEPLRALFYVDSIDMFQMNKALTKHIWPLNDEAAPDNSSQKEKQSTQDQEEDSDHEPKKNEKRQKKGGSGLLAPLPLSDATF